MANHKYDHLDYTDRVAMKVWDAGATTLKVGAAATAGTIFVGSIASRRFRYVIQAIFHWPMALFASFMIAHVPVLILFKEPILTIGNGSDPAHDEAVLNAMFKFNFQVALVLATLWTLAYIGLRTIPKWRALKQL